MRLLTVLTVLLLAACGGGGDDVADGPVPPTDSLAAGGGISRAENDLVIEVDAGDGSPVQRFTLTCVGAGPSGDLPDPAAACAHLDGMQEPFAEPPADQICTEQYGGPQTATITGLWRGEPVDARLSRTDGCAISRWDALAPLLPVPVGGELPGDTPQ